MDSLIVCVRLALVLGAGINANRVWNQAMATRVRLIFNGHDFLGYFAPGP
jgi:hypothetical protein